MIQAVSWEGQFEHTADRICTIVWRFSEACTITMYIVIALFAALRMYAIWNSDYRIGICVLALGLIYPIVNIYYVTTLVFSAFPPPVTGCGQHSSLIFSDVDSDEFFFIFGTIFGILFECVVIALTWIKTVDIQQTFRKLNPGSRGGISYLLLRDGTTYFVTLLLLNILSLLSIRVQAFNNMPTLIDTLTSILISRFILDLRDNSRPGEDSSEWNAHLSEISDVQFAVPSRSQRTSRFIGNLGASIGLDDDIDDSVDNSERQPKAVTVSRSPLKSRFSRISTYG